MTTSETFWAKVNKTDGCWLWTGRLSPLGYGRFKVGGKTRQAHRVAWFLEHGRWPEPCCLHRCDVRNCVRPSHLFEGTLTDNNRDRKAKGRNRCQSGERNNMAKLSDETVRAIRERYAVGGVTQTALAHQYGVSLATIHNATHWKTWSHTE